MLAACGGSDPEVAGDAEQAPAPDATSVPGDVDSDDTPDDSPDDSPSDDVSTDDATTGADDDDAPDPDDSQPERETLSAEELDGRGLRTEGEEPAGDDGDAGSTASTDDGGSAATPTPEAETVAVEPTATPVPTPTPTPAPDPVAPQVQIQLPPQQVPSDDLQVEGPPTDDGGEFDVISDNGVLACVTTEAAIEFLDRGDLTRLDEALQSASALASAASESGISALSTQLGSVGRDSDAAFAAIVSMLSACADYGYEV